MTTTSFKHDTVASLAAAIDRAEIDRLSPDWNRSMRASHRYHSCIDRMFELAIRQLASAPGPSEAEVWLIQHGLVEL